MVNRLKYIGLILSVFFSVYCSEAPADKPDAIGSASTILHTPEDQTTSNTAPVPTGNELPVRQAAEATSSIPKKTVQAAGEYFASAMNLKPNGQDQSAEINRAFETVPVGSSFVFDTGPEFIISSPISISKSITLVGRNTKLTYTGPVGVPIISIQSSHITLRGLKISAPYGRQQGKSFIIGTSGNSNSNPLTDINITECTFTGYSGVGINLRYVSGFTLLNNLLSDMPYAAIACYSVTNGVIEGNTIKNITAEGTTSANAYGITIQQLGKDLVSKGVRIANNKLQGIPWEGIDTHGAENLYIYNNEMKDCAVGIAMVSTRVKSPQMIIVANNRIENQGNTKSAIRFDGRSTAKNATGIIVNNDIVGQHIRLESTSNLLIFGNQVRESETGYGIYLSGQNLNTAILNNSIQDVWSKSNGNTYAIYFDNDSNTATIDGNRLLARGFKAPNNSGNRFGFKINEKSKFCSADIGTNDFAAARTKDYVNAGNSKKTLKGSSKSKSGDYSTIEDRSVILLNDMSAKASIELPRLTKENDGMSFVLTNSSKKSVASNITITSLKDPSIESSSIPGSSTIIFFYDYYAGKIWKM